MPEYDHAQESEHGDEPSLRSEESKEKNFQKAQRQKSSEEKREYIDEMKKRFSNLSLEEMKKRFMEASSQVTDVEEGRSEYKEGRFLMDSDKCFRFY